MKEFKKFKQIRKKLDKKSKRDLDSLVFFLRTAMITEMGRVMSESYVRFTDNHGFVDYYETAMEICDKVLLSNDSEFIPYCKLRYIMEDGYDDYFPIKFDDCMDWFFMNLATTELHKQMKDWGEKI